MCSVVSPLVRAIGFSAMAAIVSGLASSAQAAVAYQGRATIVSITDSHSLPGGSLVLCDTGPLPGTGGTLEQSVSNVNEAGGALRITLANAATAGVGSETKSDFTMSGFDLIINAPNGGISTLHADAVTGEALAAIKSNGSVELTANASISGLILNGQAVNVTGKPGQVVAFPGGTITLNEQTSATSDGTGSIAVVAIHIMVEGCMNARIGTCEAGISGSGDIPPPPPEGDCGKITGGGWITGTPSGAKGTFGVGGGIRFGEFWGHLQYIDHDTGMNVHATAVTGFTIDPADSDCAIITYEVNIDGAPGGTATVRVCDEGEPGRDDIFDLTLSNGYHAGGDLGGARPGGGNIQMHKCPPGWTKTK